MQALANEADVLCGNTSCLKRCNGTIHTCKACGNDVHGFCLEEENRLVCSSHNSVQPEYSFEGNADLSSSGSVIILPGSRYTIPIKASGADSSSDRVMPD